MKEIEKKIDYHFKNNSLLTQALTHPSANQLIKKDFNYEKLEFLGDAVLSLIITEMLIKEFPQEDEGSLARRKAHLVSGEFIHKVCNTLSISKHIIMGEGEEKLGGRTNPSILENIVESIIGAIYLDGGINECKKFINKNWYSLVINAKEPPVDPKTFLQEWAQARGFGLPIYTIVDKQGSSHSPVFFVEVRIDALPKFKSSASSKKIAEKEAAKNMIDYIQRNYEKK